ncbi:MAG: hypothetical protein IPL75_12700 [Acidobacteria bacterium]|nr:hypothetical protein [Acidobacteriota bacterium]
MPGTRFEPKATVIIKVPVGTTTPPDRLVEAFPLNQVVLDRDTQGRDTPFIKNRDKFLCGRSRRPTLTRSSTTSERRLGSRNRRARGSLKGGTTRPRGCAGTQAVTT